MSELQSPIQAYLSVHPRQEIIDYTTLQSWCEEGQNTRDPLEHYHLGNMRMELALTDPPGATNEETIKSIESNLEAANNHLKTVRDAPTASRSLKGWAHVLQSSLDLQLDAVLGDTTSKSLAVRRDRFEAALMTVAKQEVGNRRERSAEDINFLHTLTAMLVINGTTSPRLMTARYRTPFKVADDRRFVGLPGTSRVSNQQYFSDSSWNILFWDFQKPNRTVRVRLGDRGAESHVQLPIELLAHADYAAKHQFGTLQACIDQRPQKPKAEEHVKTVRENVINHILNGIEASAHREFPKNLLEWYSSQHPNANPYLAYPDYVDHALPGMEAASMAGSLSAKDTFKLAWFQAELGASRENADTTVLENHFDRAIEMFGRVANGRWKEVENQPTGLLRYQALIAQQAAYVQKAIVLKDENLTDKVLQYQNKLSLIANRIIERYGGTGEDGRSWGLYAEALQQSGDEMHAHQLLHRLLYQLTTCIVGSQGRYIALPSSPHQQNSNNESYWDVTVIKEREDGSFWMTDKGRIRFVADGANRETLFANRNILAVTPSDLGHNADEAFGTLGIAASSVLYPDMLQPGDNAVLTAVRLRVSESAQYSRRV